MSGSFTSLDQDEWKELTGRHISKSGNIYAGREYRGGYEVKVFVSKIKTTEKCTVVSVSADKSTAVVQTQSGKLITARLK